MTDSAPYSARRRGLIAVLIAVLVAFLLGIVATAAAVRHWDRLALLLHPMAPIVVTPPQRFAVAPQPASPPAPPATDPALVEQVDAIEERIDTIEARSAEATGDADRAERLLVAFAARRALDRGQPLGYLEGMLRDRFGADDPQSVAMIIGAAQRPATLTSLREGFDRLAPALVTPAPDAGWWTGFKRELGDMFVVRRAGAPSPLPADRLARADHALSGGQVDVALTEVARLPARAAATGWIAAARRYVLARNALDRIETAALLSPPSAVPPGPPRS